MRMSDQQRQRFRVGVRLNLLPEISEGHSPEYLHELIERERCAAYNVDVINRSEDQLRELLEISIEGLEFCSKLLHRMMKRDYVFDEGDTVTQSAVSSWDSDVRHLLGQIMHYRAVIVVVGEQLAVLAEGAQ